MSGINFFREDISFDFQRENRIRNWINYVIGDHDREPGEINVIFCSDDYLLKINRQFLHRESLTDVIAFDYNQGNIVSGDIFISIERITENAEKYSESIENELNRIIIHGVLHLLGHQDSDKMKKEAMRAQEDKYLSYLKKLS